jgi:hypothetical protein
MITIVISAKVSIFYYVEPRPCRRKIDFYRLPKILVFQLKRFSFGRFRKVKLNNRVLVQTNLDLSSLIK